VSPTKHDTEVLPRPSGTHPELNEALAAAAPRRWWNRTTLALLGAVLLAGGFVGGVQAHERWGTEDIQAGAPGGAGMPSSGGPGGGASRAPGGEPTGGAQPAVAAGGTSGTVKLVDGGTLYVQTEDGETITVRTSDSTTVKVSQTTSLESITSGVPVTVEGVPDAEGIITATTVTAG
jgi:hypothetical protein